MIWILFPGFSEMNTFPKLLRGRQNCKNEHDILVLISNAQNPPSNASRGGSRISGNLGFVCKKVWGPFAFLILSHFS